MRAARGVGLVGSAMFLAMGGLAMSGIVTPASATVTVAAGAAIYDAGNGSPSYGSSLPTAITLASGALSVQFSSVTGNDTCTVSTAGCISINGGGNYNDADGNGAAVSSSSNSGTSSISGMSAPGAGYLVGLFVATGGPSGTAPAALSFTGSGGTSFTSLSPLLDQTFFIGDGLTGDGTGSAQTFYVPTGAATLYLGISDACGYNGAPTCYSDNSGTFSLSVSQQSGTPAVPEPATLPLLAAGALALGTLRRRRHAA